MKALSAIVIFLCSSPLLLADNLVLNNGNELSGVVTEQNDKTVTIRVEGGEITLAKSMVKSVNKTQDSAVQNIEASEKKSEAKLLVANQERLARMQQFAASLEEASRNSKQASAVPASLQRETNSQKVQLSEPDVNELADRIQAKLELLQGLSGDIRRTGFWERQNLRSAILSELFPNYRTALNVW